jgi:hypothetical protein
MALALSLIRPPHRWIEERTHQALLSSWMTGRGRPPRAARPYRTRALARSHRTRPPPADTRRACCHVLSSCQRTDLLAHPPSASQPPKGEPFKLTNPRTSCQALISAPTNSRAARAPSVVRRDIAPWGSLAQAGVASPAMPTCGIEPGGFSDLKVGMRAVCVRRGPPFGFPCAPVTLRRA